MELIVLVLVPFPLGYFIRNRLAAFVAYIAVHGVIFTFQTLELIREWVGGSTAAFPKDPNTAPWAYGLVNAIIFAVGLGLVWLGHRLRNRRRAEAAHPVDLAA
jgi:predicted Na+-dependent transporter